MKHSHTGAALWKCTVTIHRERHGLGETTKLLVQNLKLMGKKAINITILMYLY